MRIPWTDEPGGLQSIGSQRVGHDWETKTFTCSKIGQCKWLGIKVLRFYQWGRVFRDHHNETVGFAY